MILYYIFCSDHKLFSIAHCIVSVSYLYYRSLAVLYMYSARTSRWRECSTTVFRVYYIIIYILICPPHIYIYYTSTNMFRPNSSCRISITIQQSGGLYGLYTCVISTKHKRHATFSARSTRKNKTKSAKIVQRETTSNIYRN